MAHDDREKLRDLVTRMLATRVALGASDTAGELATIVKYRGRGSGVKGPKIIIN